MALLKLDQNVKALPCGSNVSDVKKLMPAERDIIDTMSYSLTPLVRI
ncbi:MAG: hypothetical protein NT055_00210 [Nitrospirae bacterium]|nr:hypothetical protein [Nitrospirota bacterium]